MRNFVIRLFVNALALSAAARVVSGIELSGDFGNVLMVALVFGLLNALVKPVLMLLSFPVILLTLGLFAFVLNGIMLLVTANLTEHLAVSGLGAAIIGSLVVSLVSALLGGLLPDRKGKRRRQES